MGIKYKSNEDFFKKWTEEMAYTLGYFYADGSLENATSIRGKYIRVSSIDKATIVNIKNWLSSEHTIIINQPSLGNRKTSYLLRIGSHKLYDDLALLGLYPNKSLTITFPDIPKKYLSHFIRGYFDGDGCVRLSTSKGVLQKLSTVFTRGSKEFLLELAKQIQITAQTKQLKVYDSRRSYMLSYSTTDSIKVFKLMYGRARKPIYLKRKIMIYYDYFRVRPLRLDGKVKSILQCLS